MKALCAIPEYSQLNSENDVTISFNEIANVSYIYHGTCQLYHEEICKNGLTGCYSIFKNCELENLVALLNRLGMSNGVKYNHSPKHRIEKYIREIRMPSLSFTFSAYQAFYYSSEIRKGGQIFIAVRDALDWIQWGSFKLEDDEKILVAALRDRIKEIARSKGSVYCVLVVEEIQKHLEHIDAFNDVSKRFDAAKFTGENIPVKNIVGVIHLEADYIPNHFLIKKLATQILSISTNIPDSLVFKLKQKRFQ